MKWRGIVGFWRLKIYFFGIRELLMKKNFHGRYWWFLLSWVDVYMHHEIEGNCKVLKVEIYFLNNELLMQKIYCKVNFEINKPFWFLFLHWTGTTIFNFEVSPLTNLRDAWKLSKNVKNPPPPPSNLSNKTTKNFFGWTVEASD